MKTTSIGGEVRYGLSAAGGWSLGPTARLVFAHSGFDRLAERNAESLALSGDGDDSRMSGGAGGFARWEGRRGHLDLALVYVRGSRAASEVDLSLAGAPISRFVVRAPEHGRHALSARVAGMARLGGGWWLGGHGRTLIASGESDFQVGMTLGFAF